MNRKRVLIILGVIVLLFLGIFTFAQGNNDDPSGKKDDGSKDVIKDPDEEEEEEEVAENEDEEENESGDTTAPVIVLNGSGNVYLEIGGTYTELGATLTDNEDDDKDATVTGTVETSIAGLYVITYSGEDESGNDAADVTRNVYVKPVITAESEIVYEMGDAFPILRGTALSNLSEDPILLFAEGSVDFLKADEYLLRYNYSVNGASADEKITRIVVQDTTAPSVPTVELLRGSDDYDQNWTNKDVTVNLNSTDSGTGILKYQYSLDGGTVWTDDEDGIILFTGNTNISIIFRAVDNNIKESLSTISYNIRIDQAEPVI